MIITPNSGTTIYVTIKITKSRTPEIIFEIVLFDAIAEE